MPIVPLYEVLKEISRRNIVFALSNKQLKQNYNGIQYILKQLNKLHKYKQYSKNELFKLRWFIWNLRDKIPYSDVEAEVALELGAGRIAKAKDSGGDVAQEIYSTIGETIRKLSKCSTRIEKEIQKGR